VGQNRERGGAILTHNELFLPFGVFLHLCQFWWKLIKKCGRESARRRTDTLTDANRFYNLSHAICYSYGTDNQLTWHYAGTETAMQEEESSKYQRSAAQEAQQMFTAEQYSKAGTSFRDDFRRLKIIGVEPVSAWRQLKRILCLVEDVRTRPDSNLKKYTGASEHTCSWLPITTTTTMRLLMIMMDNIYCHVLEVKCWYRDR